MELITKEIYEAILYLVASGVIYFIYKLSKGEVLDGENYLKIITKGLLITTLIGLVAAGNLGNPSCSDVDCEYFDNNGYEPKIEQRIASYFFVMVLLGVPIVLGAINGRKK